jgi:acetylornithine deacetylase
MSDPFGAEIRDGRLYGRGAHDMKGALAACLGALKGLRDAGHAPAGDLQLAAVADEEFASLGMQEVLRHHRPDGAIVTEPTALHTCLAHKGFIWFTVTVYGRAYHGSRFDEGVDANMRMGRFLARLEALEQALRRRRPHPLVGPPSLHAATLQGGSAWSVYAAESRLGIERRTIPGETSAAAQAEIAALLEELASADPTFRYDLAVDLVREPFATPAGAPLVRAVDDAARLTLGREPRHVGDTVWMDAALLQAAGVETVVIGPAGAGSHASEEWVALDSVVDLAAILADAALRYCI